MKAQKKNKIILSTIKTLCYADVFDFPLKSFEVAKFYIGHKRQSSREIYDVLEAIVTAGLIDKVGDYHFLKGRESLVQIRNTREKESMKKIGIANNVAKLLGLIPSVKFIGISGSLSMLNAKKTDDIDLFIITGKYTLWITRFLVNTILLLTRNKRSRNDSLGFNLICPNMFVACDSLNIGIARQNLFSAHEVVQLKILVNRDHTYERLLSCNSWILKFLPNFKKIENIRYGDRGFGFIFAPINFVFFVFQFLYMRNRITFEEVTTNVARFHPKDKTKFVLDLYRAKYKSYLNNLKSQGGISLDTSDTRDTSDTLLSYTPGY